MRKIYLYLACDCDAWMPRKLFVVFDLNCMESVRWGQQHARGPNLCSAVGCSLGKQCGCELEETLNLAKPQFDTESDFARNSFGSKLSDDPVGFQSRISFAGVVSRQRTLFSEIASKIA